MPRLSLFRPDKKNDYRFMDRVISEQLTVGGTDLLIHKYQGVKTDQSSVDATQPHYDELDPTNIQDLLFLENRDRKYEPDIYRLRGHYNVQNLDFDLSQFGLFLNSDVIFITVHYNDMIDLVGRKLIVGDVLELPHLLDYHPLDENIPVALKRFYQVTDSNYASEGFSQTWYPHLWRIKCEPLIDSQEFSGILKQPIDQENYLGDWNSDTAYPPGYTVTFGETTYESIIDVPEGTSPPDTEYWKEVENDTLTDILSRYNKNIAINDAALKEAKRILPKAGYDTSKLYVVPTFSRFEQNGILSNKDNQPANPVNIFTSSKIGTAIPVIQGSVVFMRDPKYKNPSAGISISKEALRIIWDVTTDYETVSEKLEKFVQASLQVVEEAPIVLEGGSHSLESTKFLAVQSQGPIIGPYGTADNTFATADQDSTQTGFTDDITEVMNFRADTDPRFQFIVRSTPQTSGYTAGYLTGDGTAPNGFPLEAGIAFTQNPQVGDYFLRIDYEPQILYRWDGTVWVRISENVRTETGFTLDDQSQLSGFINNNAEIFLNNTGEVVSESQSLSTILKDPDQD